MKLYDECKDCLMRSQLKKAERSGADGERLAAFKEKVGRLCVSPPAEYCAPLLMRDIDRVHREIFGCGLDYSEEKRLFNGLLLEREEELFASAMSSPDPLDFALRLSMAANYIDFARLADLGEHSLGYVFGCAAEANVGGAAYSLFREKLGRAATLCVVHDNCGEIVLDKILVRVIKELYPSITVTGVVRGGEIINDVTAADAAQTDVGRYERVIDSGAAIPGTYLPECNAETVRAVTESDVVLAKGLGNFETLSGGGLAAFYAFNCKCEHIAGRVQKPLWSAAFVCENIV